ncbi:hypothetical protein WR25_24541 [Diploscapter pachys]|uniref:SHSP domain-containing protein n=1 Tax=Diploscapter pachys TaxID=2018661 RepID=A0A2A2KJP2_9BILA|nr:hypothetical protein WR25_24541 [Diploscapter pachys]
MMLKFLKLQTISIVLQFSIAQNCFNAPAPAELAPLGVYFKAESSLARFELSQTTPSEQHALLANQTARALLTNDVSTSTCPTLCLYRLLAYEAPSINGGTQSILYVREGIGEFVPVGYQLVNSTPIYCSKLPSFCGANVPFYRYYRLNTTAIHHAYSFNISLTIPPFFVPEGIPLCYMWGSAPRISRQPAAPLSLVSDAQLVDLTLYVNDKEGSFFDTYLTTRTASEVAGKGYRKVRVFGQVLTQLDPECHSLRILRQAIDDQPTGVFKRYDSKLIANHTSEQLNLPYEKYAYDGEQFYCAATHGACGATVPLYKFFNYLKIATYRKMSAIEITHDAAEQWDWPLQHNDGVVKVHNTKERFEVGLDVSFFTPKEIEVKVSGQELLIHCRHELRNDVHGTVAREINRAYRLPDDVDVATVKSHLNTRGVLMITAGKKA